MVTPGSITVPLSTVADYYAGMGLDAEAIALAYIQAWVAKVPSGTWSTIAKMKCDLADGPCGCADDSTYSKCTGPYPQVPIEVILKVLKDGVPGVGTKLVPAAKAIMAKKTVHYVEFTAPFDVLYVTKI